MTNPTPERIAAALALAAADDAWYGKTDGPPELGWDETSRVHYLALQAYRATAPKLRTRAEVDAEKASYLQAALAALNRGDVPWCRQMLQDARALCDEPTADPQPYGSSSDESASSPRVDAAAGAAYHGPRPTPATKESSDTAGVDAGAANAEDADRYVPWHCPLDCECRATPAPDPNRITDHDADQREPLEDPEACSCEESEALKDELKECRQLLDYARRCAQDIVTVLDEARK